MAKLKAELMYAKLELEKISKAGGDIHEARRRVVWLEDRMESLLSRYRKMPGKKQVKRKDTSRRFSEQIGSVVSFPFSNLGLGSSSG